MTRLYEGKKRRTPATTHYEVVRRDGCRLAALTLPLTWSDRSAVVFKSKARAKDFVRDVFGREGAKMAGIRGVRGL